jgi:class 3 adenylate cyclase
VAHAQASQLVRVGVTLKSEKRSLLRYLPKDLSAHIQGSHEGGVRRAWLTVVFVDLVGFTKATQELPAEALVTLLNDFLGGVNTLVEQWDGHVSKFLGDGVLCVFPSENAISRDNAAVQAVRCVGQLPGMLAALNSHWRKQGYLQDYAATVGVASGFCCTGDWGNSNRLDYTVIGVPVNLACRLQGEAGIRGGVLLDQVTASLVKNSVAVPASEEIHVVGMGALQAFPLLAKR